MDLEKQRVIISFLANNKELMALCSAMIKPSYFDPELRKSVTFLTNYFEQYHDIPKLSVFRAETGIVLEDTGKVTKADETYIAGELETFCRDKAVTEAILKGPALLDKGNFGEIVDVLRAAISVGLQRDLGIDYFTNPKSRLISTLETNHKYSTGLPELDALISGGLERQELLTILGTSGGGKSMTMLNIAKNFLAQGLNGIYFSLEMSESAVSKRLDSMISKVAQDKLADNIDKVGQSIEQASESMGRLFIKRLPENRTNIGHFRAYAQQVIQKYGINIDFIVVDYLDITGTTHAITTDSLFIKDKFVTEEVRSLGYDFNCIMVSASQLGRHAEEAQRLSQSNIQGGMSKINTSDYVVAVRQDELMRSAGEIAFEILKTRNSAGVGHRLLCGWDPVSLTIFSRIQKLLLKKKPILLVDSSLEAKKSDVSGLFNL